MDNNLICDGYTFRARAEHVVRGTFYDYYIHHGVLLLNVKCRQYSSCESGNFLYRFNTCLVNL